MKVQLMIHEDGFFSLCANSKNMLILSFQAASCGITEICYLAYKTSGVAVTNILLRWIYSVLHVLCICFSSNDLHVYLF